MTQACDCGGNRDTVTGHLEFTAHPCPTVTDATRTAVAKVMELRSVIAVALGELEIGDGPPHEAWHTLQRASLRDERRVP